MALTGVLFMYDGEKFCDLFPDDTVPDMCDLVMANIPVQTLAVSSVNTITHPCGKNNYLHDQGCSIFHDEKGCDVW